MYRKFITKPFVTIIFTALFAFISACSHHSEDEFHETQLLAFGTLIEITLGNISAEQAATLFHDLNLQLQNLHSRWHAWAPDSITAQINNACKNKTTLSIDPETKTLILTGQHLENNSQGLFNPAMGELISLWGFLSNNSTQTRVPPTPEQIHAILETRPSLEDISINHNILLCKNPNVRLDFGAFGKGYGIEILMDYLKQHQIKNALINAGGDLKVIGNSDHRAWRIAIRSPFSSQPLGYVAMRDNESIMTSGTYERLFIHDGLPYHHILDPRTGYPAQGFASVTVIHPDATLADAAATALLIAGPTQWQEIAQQLGVTTVLLVDLKGNTTMTPAMESRIEYDL